MQVSCARYCRILSADEMQYWSAIQYMAVGYFVPVHFKIPVEEDHKLLKVFEKRVLRKYLDQRRMK
jgi:hypothetical protein